MGCDNVRGLAYHFHAHTHACRTFLRTWWYARSDDLCREECVPLRWWKREMRIYAERAAAVVGTDLRPATEPRVEDVRQSDGGFPSSKGSIKLNVFCNWVFVHIWIHVVCCFEQNKQSCLEAPVAARIDFVVHFAMKVCGERMLMNSSKYGWLNTPSINHKLEINVYYLNRELCDTF